MRLKHTCPCKHGLVEVRAGEVERRGKVHARAQAGGGGVLQWDIVIAIRLAVAAALSVAID